MSSSLRSFLFLFFNQVFTRVFTFVLILLVARNIGPTAYGLAAIHLYLLNTTILFITRDAIRKSTLRYSKTQSSTLASEPNLRNQVNSSLNRTHLRIILNLGLVALYFSLPLTLIVTPYFVLYTSTSESVSLQYIPSL